MSSVDSASPERIRTAIRVVNQTPGLGIRTGSAALWALFDAPQHAMLRMELEARFGALDRDFGCFCSCVAQQLGDAKPEPLALVDRSEDDEGYQILTLKRSVIAAFEMKPH